MHVLRAIGLVMVCATATIAQERPGTGGQWVTREAFDALNLDFVELDSLNTGGPPHYWSFLKSGADTIQIMFGTPLTQAQMDRLINN